MADQGRWSELIGHVKSAVVSLNGLAQAIGRVFPAASGTATSATAGTNGAVPAQVAGYLLVTLPNGQAAKIPFYNT
jgi:hypothetical protein